MEIPNFSPEEQEEIINTFLSNLVGCKKVKKINKINKKNEPPVEYAYQYGANEIHKIIGTLDETQLKVENHRGCNYERHPDKKRIYNVMFKRTF